MSPAKMVAILSGRRWASRKRVTEAMLRIIMTSYYWKRRIVMISNLSSLVAPRVSKTKTSGAVNDDKIDITTTHFFKLK